jgi:4-hydroxybenzoate polyprenyltransferase
MALGVLTWVAGFDILYACQDVEFDRSAGLHSVPAKIGVEASLRLAPRLHAMTPLSLGLYGLAVGLRWPFYVGLVVVGAILVWEHSICRGGDLTKIEKAFFDANVAVSLTFLVTCIAAVA